MFSVNDKIVIITGAGNGIGANTVKEFLKKGAKFIAILDIDEFAGTKVEVEMEIEFGGNKAGYFKCDVSNTNELLNIFEIVTKDQGAIDIVINNAGIASETLDTYIKEIEVNFLMRADRGGKGGTIINISSITALSQNIGPYHIYAATKNAVLTFSNRFGLDKYYSNSKVRVLTICFGVTDTQILHTCKGFDDEANKEADEILRSFKNMSIQTSDVAAKGVLEVYERGLSGSTWLISKSNCSDITDKIKEADKILSSLDLM